jgi:hypothetical protein
MPRFTRTDTSWVPCPAIALAAGHTLRPGSAQSVPPIAHGQHHGPASVGHCVGHDVGRGVGRKSLSGCSWWAAGARPVSIPAKAAALMLRKDASGLRALGLTPASLLRTAHASLPAPRSRRAPAGQGQSQHPRGAQDRHSKRCERSLSVRNVCARAAAPDHRPIPSLCSVIPQVGGRTRCARREAPYQSRLGALLQLSLVGTRSCFCRDRLSQRWGDSFSLRRLGAANHGSPALGGLRKLPLKYAKVLAAFAPVAGATYAPARRARTASARPKTRRVRSKRWINCGPDTFSNRQPKIVNPDKGAKQPSCHSLN